MTDERWQLTYAIYEAAAALAGPERQQYVHAAAPDAEIASKVLALLEEMKTAAGSDTFSDRRTLQNRRTQQPPTVCRVALRSAVLSSPVLSAREEWAKSIPLTTPT